MDPPTRRPTFHVPDRERTEAASSPAGSPGRCRRRESWVPRAAVRSPRSAGADIRRRPESPPCQASRRTTEFSGSTTHTRVARGGCSGRSGRGSPRCRRCPRAADHPGGHGVGLERHLREHRLGDVVVAAPVGRPLGEGELVHEVPAGLARRGAGRRRRRRSELGDEVAAAAVELDQLDLLGLVSGHHRDELEPEQAREVRLADRRRPAGRLDDRRAPRGSTRCTGRTGAAGARGGA